MSITDTSVILSVSSIKVRIYNPSYIKFSVRTSFGSAQSRRCRYDSIVRTVTVCAIILYKYYAA